MKPERSERDRTIDWDHIHARLEQAAEAMQRQLQSSPERDRAILDRRTRALARVPTPPPGADTILEVVTFTIDDETYAIETSRVRGVVQLGSWTPIPGTARHVVGVINLRGEILAVFDLRGFFDHSNEETDAASRVIILGGERDEFGILANAVLEVAVFRIDQILEPPGSITGRGRQFLRGMTDDATAVLDGEALLHDDRFAIDQDDESRRWEDSGD